MKSVIFLAPPAAGKGTYSKFLEDKYGYQHISTGDLLREKALTDESVKRRLQSGMLFSDDEVMTLFKERLAKYPHHTLFVFDGIPRTLNQAQIMDTFLPKDYIVIYLDVQKDVLLKRVLGRIICPKCHRSYHEVFANFKPKVANICDNCGVSLEKRVDDKEETFLKRYEEYIAKTEPLLDYYQNKGKLFLLKNEDVALEELESLIGGANDN